MSVYFKTNNTLMINEKVIPKEKTASKHQTKEKIYIIIDWFIGAIQKRPIAKNRMISSGTILNAKIKNKNKNPCT